MPLLIPCGEIGIIFDFGSKVLGSSPNEGNF